jgi:hypothetical protein
METSEILAPVVVIEPESNTRFSPGETVELNGKSVEILSVQDNSEAARIDTSVAPKLTSKQIGQLRAQYFTVQYGTVRACGHKAKFSAAKQPSNNCVDCWTAFFAGNVDLMGVHKYLSEHGVKGLEKRYGTRFVRMFHGFLGLYLGQQQEVKQEEVTI